MAIPFVQWVAPSPESLLNDVIVVPRKMNETRRRDMGWHKRTGGIALLQQQLLGHANLNLSRLSGRKAMIKAVQQSYSLCAASHMFDCKG